MNEGAFLDQMKLPSKEFAAVLEEILEYPRDRYPITRLDEDDIDAKDRLEEDGSIKIDWLETAHAASGVNCSACHGGSRSEESQAEWNSNPDHTVCESCHNIEVGRFLEGKHGMRLKHGLAPMTPAQAELPMKKDSAHSELTCTSCHGAHRFDVHDAAVDACLACHDDNHSESYKRSPHYALWEKEVSGAADAGTGVSCASCHMPRTNYDVNEWMSRIVVDHNQSASLSPNSKMLRSSCLHCHGLEFALDALADQAMIDNNFNGMPGVDVKTMDLARQEHARRLQQAEEDDDADMFGF